MTSKALLLTGHIRSFDRVFKKTLENFQDWDIFPCIWDTEDSLRLLNLEDFSFNTIHLIPEKKYSITDLFSNEKNLSHGRHWANRIENQFYLVQQGFFFVDSYKKYEFYGRLRFDILLEDFIDFKTSDLVIPLNCNSAYNKEDLGNGFQDQLAFGSRGEMIKYFTLFQSLIELNKRSVDTSHAEKLIEYYIKTY